MKLNFSQEKSNQVLVTGELSNGTKLSFECLLRDKSNTYCSTTAREGYRSGDVASPTAEVRHTSCRICSPLSFFGPDKTAPSCAHSCHTRCSRITTHRRNSEPSNSAAYLGIEWLKAMQNMLVVNFQKRWFVFCFIRGSVVHVFSVCAYLALEYRRWVVFRRTRNSSTERHGSCSHWGQ
jgi:hypothetical protein